MVGEVVISTQMETEYSALRRSINFPTGIICILVGDIWTKPDMGSNTFVFVFDRI